MNQELFDSIFDALDKEYPSLTPDEHIAMLRLAEVATTGADQYVNELQESTTYLRSTIKRLNQRIAEVSPVGGTP